MNIRKFIARNSGEAMKMVKKEMGDDAVILRTKTISNPDRAYGRGKKGIELTAAVDYDIVEEKPVNVKSDQSSLQRLERELKEIKDALLTADAGAFLKPDYFFNRDTEGEIQQLQNLRPEQRHDHGPYE